MFSCFRVFVVFSSALIGPTRASRLAGIPHAINAIVSSSAITFANVRGSAALTPNNSVCIARLPAYASARPTATPAAVRTRPRPATIRITDDPVAPSGS